MNTQVDYDDTRCDGNPSGPILVWDLGQRAQASGVGCHVISTHTTHFDKCVPIIKTHQDEHGGVTNGYIWVQQGKARECIHIIDSINLWLVQ